MKKRLLFCFMASALSVSAFAAESQLIDFKNLGQKNGAPLDAALVMDAVSGTEGLVKEISVSNARYASGSNLAGVWFDSSSEDNVGKITISINPNLYVKATRINIYGSKAKDLMGQDTETPVVFGVNGKKFDGNFSNKTASAVSAVSHTLDNEIVRTIEVYFPYTDTNPYKEYSGCVQSIRIYYEPVEEDAREAVTEWMFAKASDTGYLDQPYVLPALSAVPAVAAEMAQYSSSDEDVANFDEGMLKLKTTGITTITATLGDNLLFRPKPLTTSYELKVDPTSEISTICQEIESNVSGIVSEIYNFQGVRMSGNISDGLYLVKDSFGRWKKVVIKK